MHAYSHRFANNVVVISTKPLAKANFFLPRTQMIPVTATCCDSLIVFVVTVKLVNWGAQRISTTKLADACVPISQSTYRSMRDFRFSQRYF